MKLIKDYLYDHYVNPSLNKYVYKPVKYAALTSLYGYFTIKSGLRIYRGDADNWHTGVTVVLYSAAGAYLYRAYKRKQARLDEERRQKEAAEKSLYNRFWNMFDFDEETIHGEDKEGGIYSKVVTWLGWNDPAAEQSEQQLALCDSSSEEDEKSSSSEEHGLFDRIQNALFDDSDSEEEKNTLVEQDTNPEQNEENDGLIDRFQNMFWDVPLTPAPSPIPEQTRSEKIVEDDVVVIDKEGTGQVVMFSKESEHATKRQEVMHGTNCLCLPCKSHKQKNNLSKNVCAIN